MTAPQPVVSVPPPSAVRDLVAVLHRIDGNALQLSPKMRRDWRALAPRLARALALLNVRALLLCLALLSAFLARPVQAQSWRHVLTGVTVGSLYVDYCQVRYGIGHGSGTWVLGQRLTPSSLVAVNASEAMANLFAPRRYRPWVNAVTLGFHVVAIYKTARRPIGILETRAGQEVARIGLRLWW